MNSIFFEKESMVVNFGDSKVGNSVDELSFSFFKFGLFIVVINVEDSGIDDRSVSLEKVRLGIEEEGYV